MIIKSLKILALTVGILLGAAALSAQNSSGTRFEITPFAGIETGASAPITVPTDLNGNPLNGIDKVGVDAGSSYGLFFDYAKTENFSYEFMWARNATSLNQHDFTTGQTFDTYDATVDQYQFGALFHIFDSSHKLRPYVAGGVGFTHTSNSSTAKASALENPFFIPSSGNNSDTAFSFNIGGGAKYYITKHFGLRGDLRFLPTYASSTEGLVCGGFGCSNGTQRNFFKRVNLAGGVVIRF